MKGRTSNFAPFWNRPVKVETTTHCLRCRHYNKGICDIQKLPALSSLKQCGISGWYASGIEATLPEVVHVKIEDEENQGYDLP